MRRFSLVILLCLLVAACHVPVRSNSPDKVLFVGNSLTYVGNLPAVYSALAAANGRNVRSDMIVRGGATLSQRFEDGSVARALATNRYTTLVLQERGGDLMCSFGLEACTQSRSALKAMASLAGKHGVAVVLLGTYQSNPEASRRLVESESAAARQVGIPYIEVSGKLQALRTQAPGLGWFAADGMHPGKDLALLNAVLVYQALHGALPKPSPLTVKAPIYGSVSRLTQALRHADDPPPMPETPGEVHYAAMILDVLLDGLE